MKKVRLFGQRELRQVGRHVRLEREKAGLTQAQIADAAGMSARAVRELEAGRSNPTLATMVAIADVLSITLDELIIAARISPPGPDLTTADETGPGTTMLSRTIANPQFRASIVDFREGAARPDLPAGAVFGHVLGGGVSISLDGEETVLRQGDSLHAQSGVLRDIRAAAEGTRILLVEAADPADAGIS